ncbi:hypothetical protein C0995_005127 [Termitomyces sp. Mi166|nr:hypothetical protein C0995_005127 [Termitomyces sp. Mi166\
MATYQGCAHAQQLIWQLFNTVEKGFDTSGNTDTAFLAEVMAKCAQMDKEKAWRAAAWAQLGNATEFYHELSYAINCNFGPSLFSLYNPSDPDPIFQIDMNLAYPAALLNALIQIPDVANYSTPLTVTSFLHSLNNGLPDPSKVRVFTVA